MGKSVSLLIGAVCLIVSVSGCVSTIAPLVGLARTRAPLSPDDVVIYHTAAQVPSHYEEVARLHSRGDSGMTSEPEMYTSMRKKAAELGANGILLHVISEPSIGAKIVGAFLGYSPQRQRKAVAIYVYATGEQPSVSRTPPLPVSQHRADPLQELDALRQKRQLTPEEYWRQRDAIMPPERTTPPPGPAQATPTSYRSEERDPMQSLIEDFNASRISLKEYRQRRDALEARQDRKASSPSADPPARALHTEKMRQNASRVKKAKAVRGTKKRQRKKEQKKTEALEAREF